jgi:hypothetical protein
MQCFPIGLQHGLPKWFVDEPGTVLDAPGVEKFPSVPIDPERKPDTKVGPENFVFSGSGQEILSHGGRTEQKIVVEKKEII